VIHYIPNITAKSPRAITTYLYDFTKNMLFKGPVNHTTHDKTLTIKGPLKLIVLTYLTVHESVIVQERTITLRLVVLQYNRRPAGYPKVLILVKRLYLLL
jgi:hypothetical protein